MLSKDAILAAVDLDTEKVAVPEWGGDVLVSEMTGEQRDKYETFMSKIPRNADKTLKTTEGLRQFAIVQCLVNERGERLFKDDEYTLIGRKNADIIDRLFDVVDRMNDLTGQRVEEQEKNLQGGRNGSSGSNSPAATESLSESCNVA